MFSTLTMNSDGIIHSMPMPDIFGRRKCIVRRKKTKDLVKEEPAYFDMKSGWYHREFKDNYGDTHIQTLGMCEFMDGHVERVDYKSIIFEEWE